MLGKYNIRKAFIGVGKTRQERSQQMVYRYFQRSSRQMSTKEAKIFKEETIVRNRKKLEE